MDKSININIHNRFDVEVIDAKTGQIKNRAKAYNIVCDNLYSLFFNRSTFGSHIHYGSGSGTPSRNDTQLFNEVGRKNCVPAFTSSNDLPAGTYKNDLKNCVAWFRGNIQLAPNEHVGVDLREVGLGPDSANIATHAVLQDMNGNPISIHKTDTDIINIYSTIYVHYDTSNGVYLIEQHASGKTTNGYGVHTILKQFFGIMAFDRHTDYGGNPAYLCNGNTYATMGSFTYTIDTQNRLIKSSKFRAEVSQGNIGGVSFIETGCGGYNWSVNEAYEFNEFMITLPVWTPYTITSESIGVGDGATTKFKTVCGFPYNAKVYVNGIEIQSGVTVKKAPVRASNVIYDSQCMQPLRSESTDAHNIPRMYNARQPRTGYFRNLLSHLGDGPAQWIGKYSNDFVNWTNINGNTDATSKAAKYFYTSNTDNMSYVWDGYNVIFDNPPAQGDVITIDYTTDYIPKDSDHVVDIELTITLGEWTGE